MAAPAAGSVAAGKGVVRWAKELSDAARAPGVVPGTSATADPDDGAAAEAGGAVMPPPVRATASDTAADTATPRRETNNDDRCLRELLVRSRGFAADTIPPGIRSLGLLPVDQPG